MKFFLPVSACLLFVTQAAFAQMPTNGLMGYWPFHTNAQDSSGHGNNGTVYGAVLVKDRFGNCNQAYRFNGVNTNIIVPNSTTVNFSNGADYTLAFWMKIDAANSDGIPVSKNAYGSFSGYQIFVGSTNPGYCNTPKHASFYTASSATQDACTNNAIDTNWHFFAGVYKGSTNQGFFYMDAVLQSDIGQSGGTMSTTANLSFGSNPVGTNQFNGQLDAIRIYNRDLSAAEITALYNEPDPGSGSTATGHALGDTTLCSAGSVVLDAGAAPSYTWSTGSHSQTITVSTAGTYWVETGSSSCPATDTAHVNFVDAAAYDFLKDTSACSSQATYILDESQANASHYLWSTGATTPSIAVQGNGTYWVDLTVAQCVIRDSIRLLLTSGPPQHLVNDTVICSEPVILAINDPALSLTWSNGSHADHIIVSTAGTYYVSAQKNGCSITDTISVKDGGSGVVLIPNVFTPNGDGVNDYFVVNSLGTSVSDFKLYNRWGTLVYSTAAGPVKWDGKQANGLVDDGTYFWSGSFENVCGSTGSSKKTGFITLLK